MTGFPLSEERLNCAPLSFGRVMSGAWLPTARAWAFPAREKHNNRANARTAIFSLKAVLFSSINTNFTTCQCIVKVAMMSGMSDIAGNIRSVREQIFRAAERAGRDPASVTLMAVTKGIGPDAIKEAVDEGILDLGENRVQEASEKLSGLSAAGRVRRHMIGHLQTNKVKPAVSFFDEVHSVDSLRLAQKISEEAQKAGKVVPVYLEINVSGETSKYGLVPGTIPDVISSVRELSSIKVVGLMTMAPYSADPQDSRPYFRSLAGLASSAGLSRLSMGMSGDFIVAIEEGATIIRVGRAIFKSPK